MACSSFSHGSIVRRRPMAAALFDPLTAGPDGCRTRKRRTVPGRHVSQRDAVRVRSRTGSGSAGSRRWSTRRGRRRGRPAWWERGALSDVEVRRGDAGRLIGHRLAQHQVVAQGGAELPVEIGEGMPLPPLPPLQAAYAAQASPNRKGACDQGRARWLLMPPLCMRIVPRTDARCLWASPGLELPARADEDRGDRFPNGPLAVPRGR